MKTWLQWIEQTKCKNHLPKRLKSEADAKNAQKTRRMDTLVSYAQAAALWRQENTCSFAFSKMTAFITFT